jgi:plasmid maintenance system antidote protein VapI
VAETLETWLQSVLDRDYRGSQTALAKAAGVEPYTINRALNGMGLSLENALLLSLATGTDPDTLLRLTGRNQAADLIRRCYGPPQELRPIARAFAETLQEPSWPALDRAARTMIETLQIIRDTGPPPATADNAPPANRAGAMRKPRKRRLLGR